MCPQKVSKKLFNNSSPKVMCTADFDHRENAISSVNKERHAFKETLEDDFVSHIVLDNLYLILEEDVDSQMVLGAIRR